MPKPSFHAALDVTSAQNDLRPDKVADSELIIFPSIFCQREVADSDALVLRWLEGPEFTCTCMVDRAVLESLGGEVVLGMVCRGSLG